MKEYECAICKKLAARGIKGEERFKGTRKEVRKHLREVHHVKGVNKSDQSKITENLIAREI